MKTLDNKHDNHESTITHQRILFLSKAFNICGISTIIVTLLFIMIVALDGQEVLTMFIFKVFDKIPYLGQILHLWIKSMSLVNLSQIYQNIFLPILTIELIYYSFFIIILQGIMLYLKRGYMSGGKGYFNYITVIIIGLAMIFGKQAILLIVPLAQKTNMNFRDNLIIILILTQIITMIAIALNQNKLGQFNVKEVYNQHLGQRFFKLGTIGLLVTLLFYCSALLTLNYSVNIVKKNIAIDYVIDLRPTADGLVEIVLPEQLIKNGARIGINIPEVIKGGAILEQVAVSEVNLGAIVNQFLIDSIDVMAQNHIRDPFYQSIIIIMFVGLITQYRDKKHKIPLQPLIIEGIEVIIAFIITLNIAQSLGMVSNIFAFFILFSSCSSLFYTYKNSNNLLDSTNPS